MLAEFDCGSIDFALLLVQTLIKLTVLFDLGFLELVEAWFELVVSRLFREPGGFIIPFMAFVVFVTEGPLDLGETSLPWLSLEAMLPVVIGCGY